MSSTREKIINYLAAGVSQSVAAQAAGVTESYVSQLLELEEVREEIAAKKSTRLERHIEVDESIEESEKKALRVIAKKLDSPVVPLREAIQAISVLNAARKKADAGAVGNNAGGADQVVIVLPRAARTMIQINSENQVVEVDGKTTAPLPSKVLPKLQRELDLKRLQAPVEPHIIEAQMKQTTRDEQKAHQILRDITTVINGATVVI